MQYKYVVIMILKLIETDYCENPNDTNYIIVYYGQNKSEYNSDFINKYRNNISYIVYKNSKLGINDNFIIEPNSKIEIYFSSPVSSLESFFDKRYDERTSNIISIDFSHFDSSLVTNMSSTFYGCTALKSIDFSNIKTSSVTDMSYMFYNCILLESNDVSDFDTSKVTNMAYMFYNCRTLQILNLSSFDTSSLLNMNSMFRNGIQVVTIDISNFDTSKVTNMGYLFANCGALKNVYYLSRLDSVSVTNRIGMFDGCTSLFGPDNSDYQESYNNTENIAIVLLGFSNYTLIDLRITFNIYFFALVDYDFPQLLNFTSVITYNSILRLLENENEVNCEKQEVVNANKLKYKCAIDAKNSNIKSIVLNNDINFEGMNSDLIISPLASEYMNNIGNLPNQYNNLFENADIYLLQKSTLNQNEKVFNITGLMEEDPNFEVNKNITLITKTDSEQDNNEINCRILDTTLEKYTLN